MSEENSPEEPREKSESESNDLFNRLEVDLGISSMDEDAMQMFELYKSLIKAGFKDRQAIRLVALIITEHDVLEDTIVFQLDPENTEEMDLEDLDFDADEEE
jgi:hypothetical protein